MAFPVERTPLQTPEARILAARKVIDACVASINPSKHIRAYSSSTQILIPDFDYLERQQDWASHHGDDIACFYDIYAAYNKNIHTAEEVLPALEAIAREHDEVVYDGLPEAS